MTTENTDQKGFVGINGEQTGLGFTIRDSGVKTEEEKGEIEFKTFKNDRKHESMRILIDLKNIFSRQLPKMPKEYIVKLVFDRNHQSIVILKNNQKVIGGICYRMYPTQRFAEIAFLAVTATEQVKGYGTRLMNVYKKKMQEMGMEYLLTYADNYAIDYFKKQGFSKEHRMPSERWKGYIKDYDGGTFMECYIHPIMDYSNISKIIKEQKKYVVEQVKKLCINTQIFNDLDFSLLRKQYDHKYDKDKDLSELDINIEKIPGIQISGWTIDDYLELKKSRERSFYLQCSNIIETMKKHKCSWPFREPVNKEDVVDYYDIIKDPIDLKTMEKNLQNNLYKTKEQLVKDVKKIFNNARTYNQPETIYYKAANDLENYIEPYLQALKEDKYSNQLSQIQNFQENEQNETGDKRQKRKPLGIQKKIRKN